MLPTPFDWLNCFFMNMDPESENPDPTKKDPIWEHETNPEAHASEWIGAVLLYLVTFGSRDFDAIYSRKNRLRNSLVGTLVKLIVFTVVVYWVLQHAKEV